MGSKGVKYLFVWQMFWPNTHGLNLLKDKNAKTFLHSFIEIVNESKHKWNKLWVNQGK